MGTTWTYNDGGREAAGFKGEARDCACRAIAIATGLPYDDVYQMIIEYAKPERVTARKTRSHPRTGVHTRTMRRIMDDLGWDWTPTMSVGAGTTVHMRAEELPSTGRYILSVSRHYSALIDGVIHDNHDPSREGTRCVYGYWSMDADQSLRVVDKIVASAL